MCFFKYFFFYFIYAVFYTVIFGISQRQWFGFEINAFTSALCAPNCKLLMILSVQEKINYKYIYMLYTL